MRGAIPIRATAAFARPPKQGRHAGAEESRAPGAGGRPGAGRAPCRISQEGASVTRAGQTAALRRRVDFDRAGPAGRPGRPSMCTARSTTLAPSNAAKPRKRRPVLPGFRLGKCPDRNPRQKLMPASASAALPGPAICAVPRAVLGRPASLVGRAEPAPPRPSGLCTARTGRALRRAAPRRAADFRPLEI